MERHSPITTPYTVTGVEALVYSAPGLSLPADVPVTFYNYGAVTIYLRVEGNSTNTIELEGRTVATFNPSNEVYAITGGSNGSLLVATGIDIASVGGGSPSFAVSELADQVYRVNPEHAYTQETDKVATAQTDGTTYYYFDMDGYKYAGWQILDTPGAAGDQTYTVEASWEDNGTAQASCDYADVTNLWFAVASVTSAAITASAAAGVLEHDTPLTCKYVRIKIVRANDGAASDGAWDIHMRGTY